MKREDFIQMRDDVHEWMSDRYGSNFRVTCEVRDIAHTGIERIAVNATVTEDGGERSAFVCEFTLNKVFEELERKLSAPYRILERHYLT